MIAIIGIPYRNYLLYWSCLPIYGIYTFILLEFYTLVILEKTLTFLSLSNQVLQ